MLADGQPFAGQLDGVAYPEVDVVEADDVAVVDAHEEVAGELLREHAEGLGDGDTLLGAEIEVAITSACFHVEEVIVEEFPEIVVVTDKDAVTLVTEYRTLYRRCMLYKIFHVILISILILKFP